MAGAGTVEALAARRRAVSAVAVVAAAAALAAAHLVRRARSPAPAAGVEAPPPHGFRLTEVSRQAGVDGVHETPTFDARLAHIMPFVASTGASAAVADFDRDGWPDVYLTTSRIGGRNRLYRNRGDGSFEDVAGRLGVADVNRAGTGVSTGSVWGDVDNDGFEDLLVYKYGRPELFHNRGGTAFVAAGTRAGLPPWVNANAATWLDVDRDGWLDLLLAGSWAEDVNLSALTTTRIMPDHAEDARNGGRRHLLRNRGDGTFEDVTARMGLASRRWTFAVGAADLSGSGYPDLVVANAYGPSELLVNDEGRQFVDVGSSSGIGRVAKTSHGVAFGDVFGDGRLAIYISNVSEPGVLEEGNDLWVPRDQPGAVGAAFAAGAFENVASRAGVDLAGWSWGAQFGDLDNDGALDLYVAAGGVTSDEPASYWTDLVRLLSGAAPDLADAAAWPPMRGRDLSGRQRVRVWQNDGNGTFIDVAEAVGVRDVFDGRAVAFADFRRRGVLDVLVAVQGGPARLYANTVDPARRWIAFDLEGTASNRSAIGAAVELYWGGRTLVQHVVAASGFSGQSQRAVHFGLGASATVERVVIRWPSGRVDTIEQPAVGRTHRIVERRGR